MVTSLQIYSQMRQKLTVILFSIHLNQDLVVSVHFTNTFPEILSTLYEAKYIEKYSKWEEKERVVRKSLPTQNLTQFFHNPHSLQPLLNI